MRKKNIIYFINDITMIPETIIWHKQHYSHMVNESCICHKYVLLELLSSQLSETHLGGFLSAEGGVPLLVCQLSHQVEQLQ